MQTKKHSKKAAKEAAAAAQRGILQLRAQMPSYNEFFEIFQKFKLSFNLLAKLKNHIHEPNAPELLHFLFTPLTVILDACHWGLGRNVAEQVLSPLLSIEACDLLRNCLSSKEHDVWMALGASWRTPPEDWQSALPTPYRPVFSDGFAPYGFPPQHFDQQPSQVSSWQSYAVVLSNSFLGISSASTGPTTEPTTADLWSDTARSDAQRRLCSSTVFTPTATLIRALWSRARSRGQASGTGRGSFPLREGEISR